MKSARRIVGDLRIVGDPHLGLIITFILAVGLAACSNNDRSSSDDHSAAHDHAKHRTLTQQQQQALATADATKGGELYRIHCSGCHGTEGKGDGPGAKNINPKPADHTNKQFMDALNDQHLFEVIRRGGIDIGKKAMPPFPNLDDQQIAHIIAFLRQISRE